MFQSVRISEKGNQGKPEELALVLCGKKFREEKCNEDMVNHKQQ